MSGKNQGPFKNYAVTDLGDKNRTIDAIVLEFEDPIARAGILAWAEALQEAGYENKAANIFKKLYEIERDKDLPKEGPAPDVVTYER